MKSKLQVLDLEVSTQSINGIEYFCITDIVGYKNPERTDIIICKYFPE